jgi:Flp pilus assembly pilin Flp
MRGRRSRAFLSDEAGATVVEYALIAMLVSFASFSALQWFGTQLIANYTLFSDAINKAAAAAPSAGTTGG